MNFAVALAVVAALPYVLFTLVAFYRRIENEAELFRMGCHPRQKQLEQRWGMT